MKSQRSDSSMDKDKQRQAAIKDRAKQEAPSGKSSGGTRGGSPEQHAKAGRQSHKDS